VALAADLRLGWRDTRPGAKGFSVGLPEVSLGVLPGTGGTQRLARTVGKPRSLELMLSGTNLSLAEAKEAGLVTALVDADSVDAFRAKVREYALRFTPPSKAAKAVGAIKRAVQSGLEMSFESGLGLERELQQQLFLSDDAREGISAYVQKRKPAFSGR
jgi:enoyl-CoA hydratase/carnithine racemase